jgi:hypothetical protein
MKQKQKKAKRIVLGVGFFQSFDDLTHCGISREKFYCQPNECEALDSREAWGKCVRLIAEVIE